MIKVTAPGEYERVGGTMIGGGTLVGLASLLTGTKDFEEICELAEKGDQKNVDMVVRDIYGENSPGGKLTRNLLASSFAKITKEQETEP